MRSYLKLVCGLSISGLVLVGAGCGKKPAADVASNPPTASAPPVEPRAIPTQPVKPVVIPETVANDSAATLAALTQALRKYAMEHHGLPKNFSEMATTGYVKNIPPAPSGKQYAIDVKACRVVLVNQ